MGFVTRRWAPLTLLICVCLLLVGWSVASATGEDPSGSEEANGEPTTTQAAPEKEEPELVRELVNKRTANSHTYLLSDGTQRVEIFAAPVSFRNEAGQWQTIDGSLTETQSPGSYRPSATPFDLTIGSDADGEAPVVLTDGKYSPLDRHGGPGGALTDG